MIMKKVEQLSYMETSDPEYFKLGKWVDGILTIPFGKNIEMPVKVSDGHKDIYNFLYDVNSTMEKSVYGHTEAKNKILQVVSQWISNPSSSGNIIALQGPPGIGKTSLVKNGISKALKRPFSMIALGGATDSSFLEGHNYTYEGSTWGRIASILMETKCMNPVIFFDELDKISETKHGDEIVGVLTHLTDQTQNSNFFDKYFTGIPFDLSKVLFVFSYNDDSRINPILKDRLIRIPLKGFSKENKILIAKDYLIPELCKNVGMELNDVIWEDDVLGHIITEFTTEEGVRELRRHIENIYLKINMLRFIDHPDNSDNKKDKKIELDYQIPNLTFPYKLTNEVVNKLISKVDFEIPMSDGAKMMYI
jgi:ATP-dependent Lon protease